MGSASDDLIAETRRFVFYSLFYGEPVQLRRGLQCSVLRDQRMSLTAELCICWSGLMMLCAQSTATGHIRANENVSEHSDSLLVK